MKNSNPDLQGIIDMDELMEIMDNDDELIKECFEDFVLDSDEMLEKIKSAIDTKNAEEVGRTAHAIKGSLKYLAAHKAADIAYQMESMGRNQEIDSVEEKFQALVQECAKLKQFMSEYNS